MRFTVSHETVYRYARPVRLTPHVLRLNPRPDGVALRARELVVEPAPAQRLERTDAFGNHVTEIEFDGAADVFRVLSRFDLETRPPAPPDEPDLRPYLAEAAPKASVRAYADALAGAGFLDRLNAALYADFRHDIRDGGGARTPGETLALRHGACRDLTVLFLAACRAQGVPARFVSGYQAHAETPDGRRHLHAWAEAWEPGYGWRGFDPTHGLAVTDGHVALAAAPGQGPTMPVEGGYWGEAVEATLSYEIGIETRT